MIHTCDSGITGFQLSMSPRIASAQGNGGLSLTYFGLIEFTTTVSISDWVWPELLDGAAVSGTGKILILRQWKKEFDNAHRCSLRSSPQPY